MPEITTELIKDLRARTSAGVMDCKKALEETDGNVEKAESLLKEKTLRVYSESCCKTNYYLC